MRRPAPWRIRAAALGARILPGLGARDRGGGGHDPYFSAMSAALHRAGVAQPTMVIDKTRLVANIAAVRESLAASGLAMRVVAKSLQAPALLQMVLAEARTDRLMVFNGVMLAEIAAQDPAADVLLGRPLPAVQVADFMGAHGEGPQWLVDSGQRLAQYVEIARAHARPTRINFEIDVGLHRGGFADPAALAAAIEAALAEPLIAITGLMGYDPHVAGAVTPDAAFAAAVGRYRDFLAVLTAHTGKAAAEFTLNTAGSLTWRRHLAETAANEVSVGSAFLKPVHFDAPILADLQPAMFIAQPVLKAVDPALVPGREALAAALEAADPNTARGFFLYGGYGDAKVVSPAGLAWSRLWGGRTLLTGSRRVDLKQDDFVFLRPTESEGVLTHFGDVAVFDGQSITDWWPTFAIAA